MNWKKMQIQKKLLTGNEMSILKILENTQESKRGGVLF